MDPDERKLRAFLATFYIFPEFSNWVRTRARELRRQSQGFEIVLVWGRRIFHAGNVPHGTPYFAIKREDGSVECSPWVND